MPPTKQELSLLINPIVPESIQHNYRILSSLHSLTAFLLGLSAGILALQSAQGFIFYFLGTIFVSGLFHLLLIVLGSGSGNAAAAGSFFPGSSGGEIEGIDMKGRIWVDEREKKSGRRRKVIWRKGAWRDVWFGGGVFSEALSGFVLGWAGVGGVLR
ncbi:hypothetical protein DTO166G4_4076 [Paecilomyces variotii]|nr:hypothetical protein DTO166G4_4076 [Paecilomyces variotii]KAJ9229904.1 hypothetical protein DTO166G5_7627 [Paecilomyces variotii]KAJ9263341.1 hypothetical protein DTO195F2_2997 [Paecilomyces variotii]KAJ9305193.1 hypothetical protein DTO217A2_5379 [Paecilomyces variotii]KAJ9351272.1 hypothetical protein DTO027B9_6505 [Paecilomyces variotii]